MPHAFQDKIAICEVQIVPQFSPKKDSDTKKRPPNIEA